MAVGTYFLDKYTAIQGSEEKITSEMRCKIFIFIKNQVPTILLEVTQN